MSSASWGYVLSSIIILGTAALVAITAPYLETHTPIFVLVIAVMVAGCIGGTGSGILAVALGAAVGLWIPHPPIFRIDSPSSGAFAHLMMFVIAGTLISILCGVMHRSRRRAQTIARDLEYSHRRLSDVLSTITDCFLSLDKDWKVKEINAKAAACFGVQQLAVIGQPFRSMTDCSECSICMDRYRKAMADQTPIQFETLCHRAINRWVEVHAYPSQDTLSVYFRDITARKRLEQEREQLLAEQILARRRVEELAAAAELHLSQLEAVINNIDQGLVIGDPHGNLLSMNPAALAIFGFENIEQVQQQRKNAAEVFEFSDTEGRPLPREQWPSSRAMVGERFSNYEVCVRRRDTGKSWIGNYGGTPIYNRTGQLILTVFTVRDITDAKRAEEELTRAKQAAESANNAKDQFLATLSHELRTPLTPVLLTLHALAINPQVPDELRRELVMAGHNVELEARLIDDLLDLTRIARGKLQLREETVDLHALLARSLKTSCDSETYRKRLQIVVETAAAEHYVRADPGRLQQVFWNLIRNAIKFTPAEGQIRIRTHNDRAGWVRVDICDTGIGIRPELLPQLFRTFEQGDQSITRRYGGLGLGLAISKAIVELHGGSIEAASEGEGRGSTFTVQLPLGPASEVQLPPADNEPTLSKQAPHCQRQLRILLVEDHEHTAKVLSRLLVGFEHDVKTASSVFLAKKLAETNDFDLVISDLGLPDGDGTELMQYLRRQYELPGIALSGFGMEDDIRRSLEAGFVRHLTKPVDLHQLQAAIDYVAATIPRDCRI
ncbi:MAG: ATP-binding protein [Bacillota bacterium]